MTPKSPAEIIARIALLDERHATGVELVAQYVKDGILSRAEIADLRAALASNRAKREALALRLADLENK